MIPIIWRYMLSQYLKVLLLSTLAFVTILMTIRLNDIAHFASFGAQKGSIAHFAFNQMIYIIPYAIPISCFISAILLIQRLSSTHELTALRMSGFSLRDIFTPIFLAATLIAFMNFVLVSETATTASLTTSRQKQQLRSINPLVLLHNKHLMKMKGIYFDTLGPSRVGDHASSAILALPNKRDNRLHLMLAKSLSVDESDFKGNQITFLTNLDAEKEKTFDKMILENISEMEMPIEDFSQIVSEKGGTIHNNQLRLPLLLLRLHQEQKVQNKKNIARCYTELIRRFSMGVSVWTFTLMGLAFGISISRHASNKSLITAIILAALYLICHLTAKDVKHAIILSCCLYLIPHFVILLLSTLSLKRVTQGVEA